MGSEGKSAARKSEGWGSYDLQSFSKQMTQLKKFLPERSSFDVVVAR